MNEQLAERYEILQSILSENKVNALNYLSGIFEEYKYKVDDSEKFTLLKRIIDLQYTTIHFENYEKYINYALKIGLKLHHFHEVIDIYKKYCRYLYKNAKYEKCSLLIENVMKNLDSYLEEHDSITFQELLILSKNGNQIKLNESLNSRIKSLMIKEKDMYQLVETFISYNTVNLHNFELKQLLNNYSFMLQYLRSNNFAVLCNNQLASYINEFTGNIYFFNGYYKHAKRHYFVSLQDEIPIGNRVEILNYNNMIAITYFHLGYLNKTENYFSIIESMLPETEDQKTINYVYSNLALTYAKKGKVSLAKAIYKKTLMYMKDTRDLHAILYYTSNIINLLYESEPNYVKKQFIIFKAINNQVSNHFYDIYQLIYEKLIDKENKLHNILTLTAKSEYFPLCYIPMFSMLLKAFPILKKNLIFKRIIKFMLDTQKEELTPVHFRQHYMTFTEYSNLYDIYTNIADEQFSHQELLAIENYREFPIRIKFKHYRCDFIKHNSKGEELEINLSDIEIDSLNNEDLLFLILLKTSGKGTIKVSNRLYKYDSKSVKKNDFLHVPLVEKLWVTRIS